MKKLLLAILLISQGVFATGKLHLNGSYYTEHDKTLPTLGLSIWEPIGLGVHYDGYTGVGISPRYGLPNVHWFVSRHDLGTYIGDLEISVGATVSLSEQRFIGSEDESNIHIKAAYRLW